MDIMTINMFVDLKTTNPVKVVDIKTGIYETITPTKIEAKLISRLISKQILIKK